MEETTTGTGEGLLTLLIWGGAVLTLTGIVLLVWCILQAVRARRAGLEHDELVTRLQGLLPLNLGALCLSAMGLMMVVVGILLG